VEISHKTGLDGHSDADVLMHAICDAVLGAVGEDDIGQFFPDTDPQWRDAPSKVFLEEAARQVAKRNGKLVNVDSMLIAEEPKIGPHIEAMKTNIASALGIPADSVGIKATTNETMGFAGRGEGMAAHAVASVQLPD
jgi:2-C-methyl-D-erythritol 2,4-cyclodiphosphate synthase